MRTTLTGGPSTLYIEYPDHATIAVDQTLDTAEMLRDLAVATTTVAKARWQPPKEMRDELNAIRMYESEEVTDLVEYAIEGADLHYRVRPGLDPDTALAAVIDAINDAATQGWTLLAHPHRAAG